MYGLIHVALKEMIINQFGVTVWSDILSHANVPEDSFMRMRSYEDKITFSLVAATSEVLGASASDCLQTFGEYWLTEFAPQGYEILLKGAGSDIFTFLENLDALHDRINTTFVGYVPPTFKLERLNEHSAVLNYCSTRKGLVPFVVGLLKGMEKRFNIRINISNIVTSDFKSGELSNIHFSIENV